LLGEESVERTEAARELGEGGPQRGVELDALGHESAQQRRAVVTHEARVGALAQVADFAHHSAVAQFKEGILCFCFCFFVFYILYFILMYLIFIII